MKEYGIYIRQYSGTPYMIHIYDNITSAKLKLYEMIQLDEERQKPYFVDNDFYNNKYNISIKLKYYCIKEREVSEWKNYSEEKNNRENDNKIIFLNFNKKVLTK
ncbi:MAG: hypothetical protein HFJ40_05525 [Clostridia bacterium]|nr:hypothetical protein [Clostridia bacterium]